jgi:membrane peptidoglycan carboxypeptidase
MHKSGGRLGLLAFLGVAASILAGASVFYVQAGLAVHRLNLKFSDPLAGVDVFAAPPTIAVGQATDSSSLIAHLTRIGYIAANTVEGGTYSSSPNELLIRPRYHEFSPLQISFDRGKITSIIESGKIVQEARMEPVRLRSLPDIRDASVRARASYRRYLATSTELKQSFLGDAIVASEDRRFTQHSGVDFFGLSKRMLRGKGASTITMQLARSLVIQNREISVIRKLREWFLAAALEAALTKDEILLAYANTIYSGSTPEPTGNAAESLQLIGVKAAALHLFGKSDLRQLSLAEGATIVALFPGPNWLLAGARDGRPERLIAFRNRVLNLMADTFPQRYRDRIEAAMREPLVFRLGVPDPGDYRPLYGYFFDALAKDGTTISTLPTHARLYTTIDPVLQEAAVGAINDVIPALRRQVGPTLNAALVALAPETGEVRALVGGSDYLASPFNRALTPYSPGSLVKPFIYAAAIQHAHTDEGPFTAASMLDMAKGQIGDWAPRDYHAGRVMAREALASSSNRAAVAVGNMMGLQGACDIQTAAFGTHPFCSGPMLLGGAKNSETSVLKVAEAYSAFANSGVRSHARYIQPLADRSNTFVKSAASERLFSAAAAFVVLQMMRSTIGDQPAENPTIGDGKRLSGLPDRAQVAGKSGSGSQGSLWVAVVHPRLVVAVVVATDDYQFLPAADGFMGGKVAGPIWEAFVRRAREQRATVFEGEFKTPAGVDTRDIEPRRGCLTNGSGRKEVFISGRLPKECK